MYTWAKRANDEPKAALHRQLDFFERTVAAAEREPHKTNIFVFQHHVLWGDEWGDSRTNATVLANTPYPDAGELWRDQIWHRLREAAQHPTIADVFVFAGDCGAFPWSSQVGLWSLTRAEGLQPYDTDDAAPTLVASGMGSGVGDNIAVVRVEAGGGGRVTLEFKPLGFLEEQSASPLDVARLFFPAMVEFRQGMLQLVEDPTVPTAERRISEAAVRQLEGATAMVRARGSHPMGKKLLCQWASLCRGWVPGPGFRSSDSFRRVADTLAKACGT